jgi:hypothetical protein
MAQKQRDTVLLIGATGSLGQPLVKELQRQKIKLRLLGRSRDTFVSAGLLDDNQQDLILCDTTNTNAYQDDWFTDVKLVISMARPRGLKKGDKDAFERFLTSLCDVTCRNQVPRFLLLGLPYVEHFELGKTATMEVFDRMEGKLRETAAQSKTTSLTVTRLSEMSEAGHLLEMAKFLHFWPYVVGFDPVMQPITASDYAVSIADFCKNDEKPAEYLVGGPRVLRWRELGHVVSRVLKKELWHVPIPLFLLKAWVHLLGSLRSWVPLLGTIADLLKIASVPMLSNTRSDDFATFGHCRMEDALTKHQETYWRDKMKQG